MEHDQLESLVSSTVMLLCKNALRFKARLKVEGLIGVTIDSTVFLVHVNEEMLLKSPGVEKLTVQNGDPDHRKCSQVRSSAASCPSLSAPVSRPPNVTVRAHVTNDSMLFSGSEQEKKNSKSSFPFIQNECSDTVRSVKQEDGCDDQGDRRSHAPSSKTSSNDSVRTEPESNVGKQQERYILPKPVEGPAFFPGYKSASLDNPMCNPMQQGFLGNSAPSMDGWRSTDQSSFQNYSPAADFNLFQERRRPPNEGSNIGEATHPYSRPNALDENMVKYDECSMSHICLYPMCGKQFHHKHHLLRHQTRKHGRTPARNRTRFSDFHSQSFSSFHSDNSLVEESAEQNGRNAPGGFYPYPFFGDGSVQNCVTSNGAAVGADKTGVVSVDDVMTGGKINRVKQEPSTDFSEHDLIPGGYSSCKALDCDDNKMVFFGDEPRFTSPEACSDDSSEGSFHDAVVGTCSSVDRNTSEMKLVKTPGNDSATGCLASLSEEFRFDNLSPT